MSRIYWDTMLFVYWLENNAQYADRIRDVKTAMERRSDRLCTSIFTVGEVLVGSSKTRDLEMGRTARAFFKSSAVELLPFDWETAEIYSQIRAENRVPPADAIHLACAARAHVDLFLTNDRRLCELTLPGIHFIAGLDTNLF